MLNRYWFLFRINLIALPYLFYPGLLGLFIILVGVTLTLRRWRLDAIALLNLVGISLLMLLSCVVAWNRGEAFLQLANFLPFFWLFALLPSLLNSVFRLEQLATDLVLATVPINLIAAAEYGLKSAWLPQSLQQWPLVEWLRLAPHKGRAMVMFDHPNVMASYLVLIFGLGLGLTLKRLLHPDETAIDAWGKAFPITDKLIYGATYLNLVGLFATGSRNGLLVAITQLIVFGVFARTKRSVLIGGAVCLVGIVTGVIGLGLGDRPRAILNVADDPRIGIWKIAIDLIAQRPWLGWGLGNFKLLYPPRLIDPNYLDVFHTHNIWLLLAVEAGLIVMLAMTIFVSYVLYRGVRHVWLSDQATDLKGDRIILIGYLLAFWGCVGFAFFDVTFYDARINVLDWVILGGIYAMTLISRNPHLIIKS
jgi:hypothetical protein